MVGVLKKEYVRQQLECEVRESLEHKVVLRHEAPLIGLVAFSVALCLRLFRRGQAWFFSFGVSTCTFTISTTVSFCW